MKYIFLLVAVMSSNLVAAQFTYQDRSLIEDQRYQNLRAWGDLNNDGTVDIVKATENSGNGCFLGERRLVWSSNFGDGTFSEDFIIKDFAPNGTYENGIVRDVDVADFDADGNLDIVIGMEYSTPDPNFPSFLLDIYVIEYFEGNGDGTFQPSEELWQSETFTVGDAINFDLEAFDFENDGDIDITFIWRDGRLFQMRHTANGNFSTATFESISLSFDYGSLIGEDINNDGFTDLLALSQFPSPQDGERIVYYPVIMEYWTTQIMVM